MTKKDLCKIDDSTICNFGDGPLAYIIAHRVQTNVVEISDYIEKAKHYIEQITESSDNVRYLTGVVPDFSLVSERLMNDDVAHSEYFKQIVEKEFGKCPEPKYCYRYEFKMRDGKSFVMEQEYYDKFCKQYCLGSEFNFKSE